MRRTLSVILFVLGGWLLAAGATMAWMDFDHSDGMGWVMVAVMSALAAPFLLLGLWASPGNRFADLGLTMMIVAGIGASMALVMVVLLSDPAFKQLLPPDKAMPDLHFAPLLGTLNLLFVAGAGYALWRFGHRRRGPRSSPG
jgi:hypothetical protein